MKKGLLLSLILPLYSLSFAALPLFFQAQSSQRISGNSIVEILHDGSALWVATNNGISKTTDGGITWQIFNRSNNLLSEEFASLGYGS